MKSAAWEELRHLIIERAVVRGTVILSSGREADYYVDLRRVTLDGKAAPLVGAVMRELTADLEESCDFVQKEVAHDEALLVTLLPPRIGKVEEYTLHFA